MYLSKLEREKKKMKRVWLALANKTNIGPCQISLLDFDLVDDMTLYGYVFGLFNILLNKCFRELDEDVQNKMKHCIEKS